MNLMKNIVSDTRFKAFPAKLKKTMAVLKNATITSVQT